MRRAKYIIVLMSVACVLIACSSSFADKPTDGTNLVEAVTTFNKIASQNRVGAKQPPLTEDEVITALRLMDSGVRDNKLALADVCKLIIKERRMPTGSRLLFTSKCAHCNGYDAEVWWIDLEVSGSGAGTAYRIRSQFIRSQPASAEN